jgi:hypothetical protein
MRMQVEAYVATESLALTRDGRVVPETDLDAAYLLVGKGCQLPMEVARKYGLVGNAEKKPEPDKGKALDAPPRDKALKAPPRTK